MLALMKSWESWTPLPMPDASATFCLGFLSVVEHEVHGLFGGYLLLNAAGQPLEFHCTAPVKPNRAQQILYGPTLESYLYGEQIGATLINASQRRPVVLLVEQRAAMSVREHIELPTALVVVADAVAQEFMVGQNRLWIPARYAADQELIMRRLNAHEDLFDLREPFERIRFAIEEAQRSSVKAA
jgi:hypothetical protein